MLPDRVSNPGPLTYESGALPIALRGPAFQFVMSLKHLRSTSYSDTNDAIDMLPQQLRLHIDVKVMSSRRHSAKELGIIVCNSIVALTSLVSEYDLHCMLRSSPFIIEMLSEIHTIKSVIFSNLIFIHFNAQ